MSIFDRADVDASASINRVFGDPVVWRPMRKSPSRYTNGSQEPDPTRPVRELESAIVSWRPTVVDPGTANVESGGLSAFDVMIDIDVSYFPHGLPKVGDIFEISPEDSIGGFERVQVARPPGDDGSSRVFFWCTSVA